jgi:hypothetical protein
MTTLAALAWGYLFKVWVITWLAILLMGSGPSVVAWLLPLIGKRSSYPLLRRLGALGAVLGCLLGTVLVPDTVLVEQGGSSALVLEPCDSRGGHSACKTVAKLPLLRQLVAVEECFGEEQAYCVWRAP